MLELQENQLTQLSKLGIHFGAFSFIKNVFKTSQFECKI